MVLNSLMNIVESNLNLDNSIDLSEIKKELSDNYNYYNTNVVYKSNIDLLLNMLNNHGLIYDYEILEDKIIINPYLNNNWFHLYIRDNFHDKFFTGIIFNKIEIIKDYYTIYINGILFDMKNYLLSSFYEKY